MQHLAFTVRHIDRPWTLHTGEYVPWHDGQLYRVVGRLITLVISIRFIGDIVVIIVVVVVIIVIVSSPCWYGDHVSVLFLCYIDVVGPVVPSCDGDDTCLYTVNV